jgi:hypothetical protein
VQSIELTAAAVQMQAGLGDMSVNLEKASRLTGEVRGIKRRHNIKLTAVK